MEGGGGGKESGVGGFLFSSRYLKNAAKAFVERTPERNSIQIGVP